MLSALFGHLAMIEFGHGTHAGLRRKRNEDTYCADVATGLFLVADGMGGHAAGERAAALARDGSARRVREGQSLVAAIRAAGQDITQQRDNTNSAPPMGTTVAALRLRHDCFEAAWVGDSRIYLLHERQLRQLSHDQSLVQSLVEEGLLDACAAQDDPRRNVLTQALGVTTPDTLQIGTVSGRVVAGMCFLLCTDGLTEDVSPDTLVNILAREDIAAQEAVDHLLLAALDAGGHDNVTAIVVRCRRD